MKINTLSNFLLISGITLSTCRRIIVHPSDLTKSDIENIQKIELCDTDDDCGPYSYCGSYIIESNVIGKDTGDIKYTKGIVNKYCIYKDFLCPEDENAKCHYIDEIYKYSYDDEFYPIINTCLKEQVEEGTCKTKKCESNQDCYSGTCYSNSCITVSPIYKCEQYDLSKRRDNQFDLNGRREDNTTQRFSCSKIDNMKCNNNSECTRYCKNGYCSWEIQGDSFSQVFLNSLKLLGEVLFATAVMLVLIVVLVIIFYYKEKRDKKKREQANKKQKKQDKKKQAKNKKD